MRSFAEVIFLLYFVSHIFITTLFDSQFLLPKWLYPSVVSFLSIMCLSQFFSDLWDICERCQAYFVLEEFLKAVPWYLPNPHFFL